GSWSPTCLQSVVKYPVMITIPFTTVTWLTRPLKSVVSVMSREITSPGPTEIISPNVETGIDNSATLYTLSDITSESTTTQAVDNWGGQGFVSNDSHSGQGFCWQLCSFL